MNHMTRTIAFVVAALLSTAAAIATYVATRPPEIAEYLGVGEPFFPNFTDADQANAILVAGWNSQSSRVERFEVVRDPNGLWHIPSHYNYPADGQKQFAQAATSAIGIVRISLVSSELDAHKKYGVIDPLDENPTIVQGENETGTRISFTDSGSTLADYIIGRPREEAEEESKSINEGGRRVMQGVYYVRAANERQVYLARVNLQMSTRFSDWIRSDLLEVERNDIHKLLLDHYEMSPQAKQKIPGDLMMLNRSDDDAHWIVDGVDTQVEQPRRFVIDTLTRTLAQLDIIGVRPRKLSYVNNLFVPNDQTIKDDLSFGFFHSPATGDIAGAAGDIKVWTVNGIRYTIRYGDINSDSGLSADISDTSTASTEPGDAEAAAKASLGRNLLVSVAYDAESLGPPPVEPTRGTSSEDNVGAPETDNGKAATDATETPSDAATVASTDATVDEDATYEEAMSVYKTRKAAYDASVKRAQERVRELEFKFSQWYYIIPEESFGKLHVSRDEMIEKILPDATTDPLLPGTPPAAPEVSPSPMPTTESPATEAKPAVPEAESAPPKTPPATEETSPEAGTSPNAESPSDSDSGTQASMN
ncbi:MAG: DUF4340 domain-containing protein [Planctomycetaceae bacterium]